MSQPFIGEIRPFSFGFAPRGWAACNGQSMAINQNQALFSILGTLYGGDGVTTFKLPNLQGATPIHRNTGTTPITVVMGSTGGAATVVLANNQIPTHTHTVGCLAGVGDLPTTSGSIVAATKKNGDDQVDPRYSATANGTLAAGAVASVGRSAGHSNMQPSQIVNFCISLSGIFPSRS